MYVSRISDMLQDRDIYDILNKDPTKKLITECAYKMEESFITFSAYRFLYCSDRLLIFEDLWLA